LVKQAQHEGEIAKVSIRSVRKEANESLKKLQKDGVAEDIIESAEEEVQKMTNDFSIKVDNLVKTKEKDIMTI
jgi:ribosome recycling factor